jgi:RND family efflux transporter MFP subunit
MKNSKGEGSVPKNKSAVIKRRLWIASIIVVVIIVVGISLRLANDVKLRKETEQLSVLNVSTIKVSEQPLTEEITLPGNVQAWHEATIYARTNGYVVKWLVDIGAYVKAGDLLAIIATPEVNAALRQAEADLSTAEANNKYAQTTYQRWKHLFLTDSVSKQDLEEKMKDANAKAALVQSEKANRDRLRDLVSFENVVAPFTGIVSARTLDVGHLIDSGSGSSNKPLFHLVQSDPLRVYVRVPEYYSSRIKPGLIAQLYFTEHPGKVYSAKLLDDSKAIDMSSRSLLLQFQLDNPNNELLPGSYTVAHLILPTQETTVIIPDNALIFREEKLQVAMVDKNNRVLLKPIVPGRDFGEKIQVESGLNIGDVIILNPLDSLITGEKVSVVSRAGA